jgi:predicted dehydrogenase
MKTLVVGCGSIGQRRARILHDLGCEVVTYDTVYKRMFDLSLELKGSIVPEYSIGVECCDAIVICTPPETHLRFAQQAAAVGKPVFVEKPIALNASTDLDNFVCDVKVVNMGACNMRFHSAVMEVRQLVEEHAFGDVISLRFEFGHDLKQWRDGAEDSYQNGVLLDVIHELDLAYYLGGRVQSIQKTTAPRARDRRHR